MTTTKMCLLHSWVPYNNNNTQFDATSSGFDFVFAQFPFGNDLFFSFHGFFLVDQAPLLLRILARNKQTSPCMQREITTAAAASTHKYTRVQRKNIWQDL